MSKSNFKRKRNQSDGSKALKLVRRINRSIEKKFSDHLAQVDVGNAGTITNLTTMVQGIKDTERIGDTVTLKSIQLRFNAFMAAGVGNSTARFIIYYDKQNSSANPIDILQNVGGAQSVHSDYHHDRRHEFVILYDNLYSLNDSGASGKIFKRFINLRNKVCQFHAGTTTVNTGAIKLLLIAQTGVALEQPGFNYFIRLNYTDA